MRTIEYRTGRRAPGRSRGATARTLVCALVAAVCTACASNGAKPTAVNESGTFGNSMAGVGSASELEGTWQTSDVSVGEMVSALQRAGLQKWVQPFRARAGMGASNVFRLVIADGLWHEEYSRDGRPFQDDFDYANYRVTGDTVALTRGGGSYRWRVSGSTLRLAFVAHSMDGSDPQNGMPGEVLQRAFYTAAPFERRR